MPMTQRRREGLLGCCPYRLTRTSFRSCTLRTVRLGQGRRILLDEVAHERPRVLQVVSHSRQPDTRTGELMVYRSGMEYRADYTHVLASSKTSSDRKGLDLAIETGATLTQARVAEALHAADGGPTAWWSDSTARRLGQFRPGGANEAGDGYLLNLNTYQYFNPPRNGGLTGLGADRGVGRIGLSMKLVADTSASTRMSRSRPSSWAGWTLSCCQRQSPFRRTHRWWKRRQVQR